MGEAPAAAEASSRAPARAGAATHFPDPSRRLVDGALTGLLLVLPLHTLVLLLLDRAGLGGPAFDITQAWKDVAALAIFSVVAWRARRYRRRGQPTRIRPADRLAMVLAVELVVLSLLPFAGVAFSQRMAGLRVNGLFLVFYGIGRMLPAAARIRRRLTAIALAVAGVLAAVGVVEWFLSPLQLLQRLDYGGYLLRRSTGRAESLLSIPGSYFTAFGVRRSGSLVLDPLVLGQICVIGAGAALAVHMVRRGLVGHAVGVLFLSSAGMVAARSRTALAAFVGVATLGSIYAIAVRWGRRTVPVLAATSVAFALAVAVVAPRVHGIRQDPTPDVPPAATAVDVPSPEHPSLQAHLDGLKSARTSLRDHPWGTGLGSNALATLRLSGPLVRENQFLLLAVEGGWLVLFTMLGFLIALFGGLARQPPDHRMASTTGLMFLLAAVTTALTAQIFLNFELVALAFLAAGAGMPAVVADPDETTEPAVLVPGAGSRRG